ncbi:MAG: hypothetical protein NTZ93_03915 [Candidatus Beckwithbacteria bacterium]|nr:hypothetical protein [Candidatus Beckwithbacteria bacterium]
MKKIIVIAIFILALGLRVYKLSLSPPGLYADEASIGYNAYSILKTGKDEHGVAWPIFFQAFGDYKNPVFIYSLAPLIKLNGLKPETIRLGAAIWGSLAIPLLMAVAWAATANFTLSCLAGVVLALMPWHLHYSRLGFEAITLPTLMLLSLWLFLKWLKNKKILAGIALALSLFLMFYSYTTARLWMPLLGLILLILFRKQRLSLTKKIVVFDSLLIMFLPLLIWLRQFPDSLTARMNQIAIWADKPPLQKMWQRFWSTYAGHFTFSWLFSRGDTTIRHSSGISSEMLLSFAPWLIIGLIMLIKQCRKQPFWQLTLIMIGLFPLAAALTQTSPIATRTLQATPFFSLAIAWGIIKLKKPLLIILALIIIGLEFGRYYRDLIYFYPKRVSQPWDGFDSQLGPAIKTAYQKSQEQKKPLFLSSKIEQAYIQGLFFTQADPRLWQTKHQTPFTVAKFKAVKAGEIWVITRDECPQKDKDYCVLF